MPEKRNFVGRWSAVRIRRPKKTMKRLLALAIGAFIVTLFLIFKTGELQGNGTGIHRLNLAGMFQQPTMDPIVQKYQGKERMPPTIENMDEEPVSHTAEFLLEYYLTKKTDGIEITWLKNNNTRKLLLQVLDDHLLMMVEVDVITKKDKSSNGTAIIAPTNAKDEYELKLKSFLKYLAVYSNKGVKINIDSLETLQFALQTLKTMQYQLHSPIWLSINVLQGPNSKKEVLDFPKAVNLIIEYYPPVSLSLGWSTELQSEPVKSGYNWYHVISMAKLCIKFQQRVSFSVRAIYGVHSIHQIKWLVSLSSRFSVTVWADESDSLSVSVLENFRQETDPSKVFYNLPKQLLDELKSTETAKSNPVGKWDRTLWKPSILDDKSLAFLGTEHAVLEGGNSWLVSKISHQPAPPNRKYVQVRGNVQFINSPKDKKHLSKFVLFIRSSGVNPPQAKDVHGVRLIIMGDGTVTFSSQNLKKAEVYKPQTMAKLPSGSCVSFNVTDSGENEPILCSLSIIDCESRKPVDSSEVSLHLRVPYDSDRQMFYIAVTGGTATEAVVVENLIIS
ncbi:uncharacterized protein [Antedon mediterranea]|uniref:uncharacterized protein n=1 Tax=Antedon mediterranea TaxID=105859 RepID=UPI003AF82112